MTVYSVLQCRCAQSLVCHSDIFAAFSGEEIGLK